MATLIFDVKGLIMWISSNHLNKPNPANPLRHLPLSLLSTLLMLGLAGCPAPSSSSGPDSTPAVTSDASSGVTKDPSSLASTKVIDSSSPSPSEATGDATVETTDAQTINAQSPASSSESQETFEGGGFTVTITGSGSSAAYRGCNANQDCIEIPQAANYSRGTYTWENGGYTYVMAPVSTGPDAGTGIYQLRVYDPSRNTIVDSVMTPVAGNEADNGDGDVVLEPNILDEFYTQAESLGACAEYFDLDASKNASNTYTVNGDDTLVEVLCYLAAYQAAYEYWFYQPSASGGEFIPLSFDTFTTSESGERSRTQIRELGGLATYDPDQQTLSLFTKYRGLGDCGSYSEYKWQGSEFELVTYRAKDECDGNGLGPDDYPQIYP